MNKPVYYEYLKNDNNEIEYRVSIEAIEDWDGFEKLAKYLEIHHQARLVESYNGPDARRWIFQINGMQIELIHDDDLGNYMISPETDGQEIITKIGKDLEERLKD